MAINISNIKANSGSTTVSATINSVRYDNINAGLTENSQVQGRSGNPWSTNGGDWLPTINAVDIDWNNAYMGTTSISNTSSFLAYINALVERLDIIENSIKNIS